MQTAPTAMYKCSFCSSAIVAQDRRPGRVICLNCGNWQNPVGHRHFSISGTRTNNIDGIYIEAKELIPELQNQLKKLDELETTFQAQNEVEKISLIKFQRTAVIAAIDLCKELAARAKETDDKKTTKICRNCFAKFAENMKFCLHCGGVLECQKVSTEPKNDKITDYIFSFECSVGWKNLDNTEDEKVRFCRECNTNVHFVDSQSELDANAMKGNCVSFKKPSIDISKPAETPILGGYMLPPIVPCQSCKKNYIPRQETICQDCKDKKSWWQFWK